MGFKAICVLLLLASLFSFQFLKAQTPGTGALTGTVKDPSGAVIPAATVTLTSVNTGQARTTMTGADGVYRFTLLPPGNYRVRMEASGFKPVEVPSVTIAVTETAVLDRNLEVGAQSQTVTVEGEVENVQTQSSALGSVVGTQGMVSLPLSTRNFTSLLAMTAGANSTVTNATAMGKGATGIAVNGADIGQNTYLQDGVAVNVWGSANTTQESTIGGAFPIPNPDAIQEFKIQTSTYDAGYGRNPGANVNVITKSGTNNFHGGAFEFFRNTALNANDFFANATGQKKLTLNQNQFGGTFGGPIKKDKLFFFLSFQETAEKNGIAGFGYSVVNLSPIPNLDRGTCPVSAVLVTQCDATAQLFASSLGAAVCPGNNPGNSKDKAKNGTVQVACDGSNINPVALRLMQLKLSNGQYMMPGAYTVAGGSSLPGAGAAAQYPGASFTDPGTFHDYEGMGNWDYIINSKHTLSGRYVMETDPTYGNFASNGTRITATNLLPGNPITEQKSNHAALLRLTSVLSNNLVNEARISYQRVASNALNLETFTNSQVGITDLTPGLDKLSGVTISGLYGLGAYNNADSFTTVNQYEVADQLSLTHGIHTFRVGFEIQHNQYQIYSPGSSYMALSFQTFPDLLLGLPACLPGATGPTVVRPNTSSFGGVPCNGGTANSSVHGIGGTTLADANFAYPFRANYDDAFVQDDIKVTSRLTINAGLRWEWDGFPYVQGGVTSNFWPSLALSGPSAVVSAPPVPGGPAVGTLSGFVVPNNYAYPVPAGVVKSSNNSATNTNTPWHNFAPRLGFAWQPTSSNRFVVRGGAGIFYEFVNGTQSVGFPMKVPPGAVNVQSSPLASLQQPGVPPPSVPGPPGGFGFTPRWGIVSGPSVGLTSNLQQNIYPENLTTPVTYEWNLNTQYEFVHNWVLELGYVGSHGIRQEQGAGVDNYTSWNAAQLITPTNSINGIVCDNVTVFCNTSANANIRSPYLGISTNDHAFYTNGSYVYNALQATVRRQFSNGLQFQLAYTWDKGLLTDSYGINTPPYVILQLEPNPDYHPQRVVFNYVWNLPAHFSGWKGRLLDDWTWSGVTTIQDGAPFTVYDSSSGSQFFQGGAPGEMGTAVLCPGVNPLTSGPITSRLGGSYSANGYLNPAAFGDATGTCGGLPHPGSAPGQPAGGSQAAGLGFGNLGLGTFLSPGQANWDMSLSKLIKIRERKTLEFRGEFFNTFNHPQFSFNPVDDPALSAQDVQASNFGDITLSSVNPRLIQFALKFLF
jgi:hypothetical protein